MNRYLLLLLIVALLLVGCDGEQGTIIITATPGQNSDCYGISDTDIVVSVNPCLRGPFTASAEIGTTQDVPGGWQIVNYLTNIDGHVDNQTDYMVVTGYSNRVGVDVQNNVTGINSRVGYSQMVTVVSGCYLAKIAGTGRVNDTPPDRAANYYAHAYIDGEAVGFYSVERQDDYALVFPVLLEAGTYEWAMTIGAGYGSAGHGSSIDITSMALLLVNDGYCD